LDGKLPSIVVAVTILLLSAGLVYWACEYFVNGVEWCGRKAGISQTAVGTVLAAFGTALPESVVTFVAVVFGHNAATKDIGVGAALGGPLVLATIAYPIVGIMLLVTRAQAPRQPIELNRRRLSRDQSWFLLIFAFKIALGFLIFTWKPVLGWLFLLAYGLYTWSEMLGDGDAPEGDLEPLKFQPRATNPGWLLTTAQTVLAVIVIFIASRLFVSQLQTVGTWLGIPATVVALLFSPIATELPETMNAVIWIRQGKHRLALCNISGSMMVQATVPTALGLLFTPWLFDHALTLAAAVTAAAIIGLLLLLRFNALTPVRLAAFASLYAVFGLGVWWLSG
jgi:cation:H+ antiporter